MEIWNGCRARAGLDLSSYPDLALGSLPNVYPYHMTITGEGIQAKRRGSACLVDHMPAPMADAGTYDELSELEKNMDEYAHFLTVEPETASHLVPEIRSLAMKAELDGEVPYERILKTVNAMWVSIYWDRCRKERFSEMKLSSS